MFAVIYRGYVFPEREKEYQTCWHQIAEFFIQHRGALGSCLHKTEKGEWLAYSRWPDRKTREASWSVEGPVTTLPTEILESAQKLKNCIDRSKPYDEVCMDMIEDLLVPPQAV